MLYSRFELVIHFIHSVNMSICQSQSPSPSHFPCPLGVHKFVVYVCVSISALQINSSVPFFLYSTYKQYYMILVFLFLTYFTLYDSLKVH